MVTDIVHCKTCTHFILTICIVVVIYKIHPVTNFIFFFGTKMWVSLCAFKDTYNYFLLLVKLLINGDS